MQPTVITEDTTSTALVEIRQAGQTEVQTATGAANAVVITDQSGYQNADLILFKIRSARRSVASLIESRLDTIIKPIRAGLDKLYEARRQLLADLDSPLEKAEKQVKQKMAAWQEAERHKREEAERLKREEEDRVRREQERIERERQEAERKVSEALTKQQRAEAAERERALREQQEELERQRQETLRAAATAPAPKAVKAAGSRVTVVRHWRIGNQQKFITAVAAGTVPSIAVQPNTEAIDMIFKQEPDTVKAWPGVEIYEETRISGR